MSKFRRQISSGVSNVADTRDTNQIKQRTGNLYESIAVISKRANQINFNIFFPNINIVI